MRILGALAVLFVLACGGKATEPATTEPPPTNEQRLQPAATGTGFDDLDDDIPF